jgi:hypothetical protein
LKVAAGGCGGCGLVAGLDLTAMGIESFFVCSLLILRDLQKSEKAKIAVKRATLRHDVRTIAREASAAGRLRPNWFIPAHAVRSPRNAND